MSQSDRDRAPRATSLSRRTFLRHSTLLTLPAFAATTPVFAAIMSAPQPPKLTATATSLIPTRARGSTVLNVRNYGATGNGSTDDTTAIQRAINALPSTGGTVDIPAGTYLIDAERAINLRSKMHLRLASGALLKAKGNSAEWSEVLSLIRVSDVEISGGEIEGERDRHRGTTGQWGMGISLRGAARVTIRNIYVRKCWGDGICIGAAYASGGQPSLRSSDVVISNLASSHNRRQGMSIGQSEGVKVYNSEFAYTSGIAPGCGIDIEPDVNLTGTANATLLQNCNIHHNQGNGLQIYKAVTNTTVRGCTIATNNGYGILAIGAKTARLSANYLKSNGLQGIGVRASSDNFAVSDNRFYNNGRRFRSKDLTMINPAIARTGNVLARHTEVSGSTRVSIGSNLYHDK